jgi:hypothetical protein
MSTSTEVMLAEKNVFASIAGYIMKLTLSISTPGFDVNSYDAAKEMRDIVEALHLYGDIRERRGAASRASTN